MDVKELEYYVTVAEEQNFSRAAQILNLAQPSLSQAIAKLEKYAGYPLFHRCQNGVYLTEQGKTFYKTARKILNMKDAMDAEMRSVTRGESGMIHLGISHYFGDYLLPKALPEFHKSYPNVEIVIHTQTSSLLEKMLENSEIDVSVMVESSPDNQLSKMNGMNTQVLFYEQILLAIAEENPIVNKAVKLPSEDYPYIEPGLLNGQSFVLSSEKMRLRQSAEAFFLAENISFRKAVTTAVIETANQLAAYNEGIAFIPASYAATVSNLPNLRYFVTSNSLKDWTVVIKWPKLHESNLLLGRFIQLFKDSM